MTLLPADDTFDTRLRRVRLSTQYESGMLGVPADGVRLSWRVDADAGAAPSIGYQLRVDDRVEAAVSSTDSIGIPAPGAPLGARQSRTYAVRVATEAGWSNWSDPVVVEAGLSPSDWTAAVVGIDTPAEGPAQLLRHEFTLDDAPERARAYATFLGIGELWINGTRVGDEHLAPGWTSYQERVLVSTFDVTALLVAGDNAVAAVVADGWYRGRFGFKGRTGIYGDRLGALVQVEVDGAPVTVTDDGWRGGTGVVRAASIYDGTAADLRLPDAGTVSTVGFDDSGWSPVGTIEFDLGRLAPRFAPPVRTVAELPMTETARPTATQLDAGQNVSGWVRLTVRGRAGDTVTVRHAEILDGAGDLFTAALRTAKATDTYILASDDEVTLEPRFTFHGFRYAEVTGAEVVSATAVAISSDTPPRSTFRSSHEALDRFHSNVQWSQRDNFVSLPTDCPQRDERLGWTGDAQAFAATASTLFDSHTFWRSWLLDLEIDQTDEGGVASIVPDIIRFEDLTMGSPDADPLGRAGWADAATIVPFAVYESYGSDEVLVQQLRSMRRWVEHLRRRAGSDVVLPHEPFQYGDWLDPDAPGDRPWEAKVDSDYVANAFYVHSTRLLARAERLVGDADAAAEYDALADRVAAATWERWGTDAVTTQTGAALALQFGIAPTDRRAAIADGLAADVRRERGRIATGFLGTPLVLFALSESGHLAEAYLMLLRREAPSWLYQVDRGATTVWERWDAIKTDGSIHGGEMDTGGGGGMLSFNHYAYGAMIDWVYRTVAGLAPDPDAPGYRRVLVAPRPADSLTAAAATIDTALGTLSIDWRLGDDGDFTAELDVPYGATATLDLPVGEDSELSVNGSGGVTELGHGRHTISIARPAVVSTAA
ncbi:alpha-L-rhamnosidase [Planctomonas psychrotolerans]|uniref:alpha-L-rhamnosidase n=1 Tax=Planctomonas psychrotolerans TaxID=2528712 RepID=UPI001239680D|nr:alpha-L-rhamnosidase [Planctomonas psychrotolerans]